MLQIRLLFANFLMLKIQLPFDDVRYSLNAISNVNYLLFCG